VIYKLKIERFGGERHQEPTQRYIERTSSFQTTKIFLVTRAKKASTKQENKTL